MMPLVESDEQFCGSAFRVGYKFSSMGNIEGQRFFDKQMFACIHCLMRELRMGQRRGENGNHIYRVRFEHGTRVG